ncbi:MAG: hypothetical protein NC548_52705 [Lachnospiraceae bacterium]|nr:hypothetical protein [Lachnospiraceae bacterium]
MMRKPNNIVFGALDSPEIGKVYLVKAITGSVGVVRLGIFNGEYWNIADDSEQLIWKPGDDSNFFCEFAEIPKFSKESLIQPRLYESYLISVKSKRDRKYRVMIGTLCKDMWTVGDTEDAFEIYLSDIQNIKVHSIPLLTGE